MCASISLGREAQSRLGKAQAAVAIPAVSPLSLSALPCGEKSTGKQHVAGSAVLYLPPQSRPDRTSPTAEAAPLSSRAPRRLSPSPFFSPHTPVFRD